MVVASQNETVRKRAVDNVYLATFGLIGCVALIIADEYGSVSLTHIDRGTDLLFIKRELALMQGKVELFLIKKTGAGDLSLLILSEISKLKLDKSNFTVHPTKESDEGTVVFNHTKKIPQVFSMRDFYELISPGVDKSKDNKLVSVGYITAQMSVDDPLEFQRRIYVRQLNSVLGPKAAPLVIYNDGASKNTTLDLDQRAQSFLNNPRSGLAFFDNEERGSLAHVIPRYHELMSRMQVNSTVSANK